MNGYGSNGRAKRPIEFTIIHATSTALNRPRNFQLPPKRAMRSAMRCASG